MEPTNQFTPENNAADLLYNESEALIQFDYATQGQRFVNWLVDNLLLRYGLAYVTGTAVGALLGLLAPDFAMGLTYNEGEGMAGMSFSLIAIGILIAYVNYIVYYTICEKLFKGYTLGKLISGTRAIRQDGGELTFKDALMRSLSRCVPFEVFSGFSTLTWHDQWTKTMVIKSR